MCPCREMNVYEVSRWRVRPFPLTQLQWAQYTCLSQLGVWAGLGALWRGWVRTPPVCPGPWLRSTWVGENTVSVEHPGVEEEHLLVSMEEHLHPHSWNWVCPRPFSISNPFSVLNFNLTFPWLLPLIWKEYIQVSLDIAAPFSCLFYQLSSYRSCLCLMLLLFYLPTHSLARYTIS